MPDRYTVHYLGPRTTITPDPHGPWPHWEAARAAAIEHLEDHVRECNKTLMCLKRAASFGEYLWLAEEMAGSAVDELAQGESVVTLQ